MASRERAKRSISTSRTNKATKRLAPAPVIPGPTPGELEQLERDPDHPLSFLPEERRGLAAQERISDLLVKLLNAVHEGSNDVDGDVRQTYLTMLNVTQAMLWITRSCSTEDPASAVAKGALDELERAAVRITKTLKPDDAPLAPSSHYDLEQKYNLKGSKLALLDAVADSLHGLVYPSECDSDGKLDPRVLETQEVLTDEVKERADQVGLRIFGALVTNNAFAKLLARGANPNHIVTDRERLTRAISVLMEQGHATVPQVARAVLYVFDVDMRSLKNIFSPKLLEEWEASRTTRVTPTEESP